jgi:hypothetical protein
MARPDVKILALLILFPHYDMTLEDLSLMSHLSDNINVRRCHFAILIGLRNTQIWQKCKAEDWWITAKNASDFTLPLHGSRRDALCRKLVRIPQKRWFEQQKTAHSDRKFRISSPDL